MLWAVGLSAAVHAAAILGLGVKPGGTQASRTSVISARLVPSPAESSTPVPGPRIVAPRRTPIPEAVAVPADLPAGNPAPADREDPQKPPAPATAPVDLPGLEDIPDSTHYSARDLDVYPRPSARVRPDYPAPALGERLAGKVRLMLLIDERGRVTEASVVDATPTGIFDEPAREAFLHAAFVPAERAGRAVRSRILVDVEFDPDRAARQD
jgi:protein TonB